MRLSLRTLLAREDKVFDIEQQRQLDKLIRQDDAASLTLRRIRTIVKQPNLGVPGRIQQREELEPNVVAEYIDEEMQPEVQERFEKFCLSSDKFLAEVASVHQILSNVLGEPARTSRECRLRCYKANRPAAFIERQAPQVPVHCTSDVAFFDPEQDTEPPTEPPKPEVVLQRVVREEAPKEGRGNRGEGRERRDEGRGERGEEIENRSEGIEKREEKPTANRHSLAFWGFIAMLVFPMGFLLGVGLFSPFSEQDDKRPRPSITTERPPLPSKTLQPQSAAPKQAPLDESVKHPVLNRQPGREPSVVQPVAGTLTYTAPQDASPARISTSTATARTRAPAVERKLPPPLSQPEPLYRGKRIFNSNSLADYSTDELAIREPSSHSMVTLLPPTGASPLSAYQTLEQTPMPEVAAEEPETFEPDSLVAFQPISKPPMRQPVLDFDEQRHLTEAVREPAVHRAEPIAAEVSSAAIQTSEWAAMTAQDSSLVVSAGQITERGAAPAESAEESQKNVGSVLLRPEPLLVFSAGSANEQWNLKPLPFNIFPEQYLLTMAPYRAELEWDNGLFIEMVGDSKICALPPDKDGVPGIFVDYGRIVIRQKAAEQAVVPKPSYSLRIRTEKIDGVLQLNGQKSAAYIDTFADVLEPGAAEPVPLGTKMIPVLVLVPEEGQTIRWQFAGQGEPMLADRDGSIQLIPNRSELGAVQNLPSWRARKELPKEAEVFARVCRRAFQKHPKNCEASLQELSRDDSPLVRSFALRLWGDLGRFDVPLAVLEKAEQGDDSVKQVLTFYFREVMKRDTESIQRLSDAMEAAKKR